MIQKVYDIFQMIKIKFTFCKILRKGNEIYRISLLVLSDNENVFFVKNRYFKI